MPFCIEAQQNSSTESLISFVATITMLALVILHSNLITELNQVHSNIWPLGGRSKVIVHFWVNLTSVFSGHSPSLKCRKNIKKRADTGI